MKKIEDSIQKELVKWMRKEYPFLDIRYNKIENKKDIVQAVQDKKMGSAVAGTPDLTLFKHQEDYTYILELELKKKDGKLNAKQIEWWGKFRANQNRQGQVGYGLIDAQEKIKLWLDNT